MIFECASCTDEIDEKDPHEFERGRICATCIRTQFQYALEDESSHPPKYGATEMTLDYCSNVLDEEFITKYQRRVAEYETRPALRVHCRHKVIHRLPVGEILEPDHRLYLTSQEVASRPQDQGAIDECASFVCSRGDPAQAGQTVFCQRCSGGVCNRCETILYSPDQPHDCVAPSPPDLGQRGKDFQYCPNPTCQATFALHSACNHMTCRRCGQHYCYICGRVATGKSGHWRPGKCPLYNHPDDANANYQPYGRWMTHVFSILDRDVLRLTQSRHPLPNYQTLLNNWVAEMGIDLERGEYLYVLDSMPEMVRAQRERMVLNVIFENIYAEIKKFMTSRYGVYSNMSEEAKTQTRTLMSLPHRLDPPARRLRNSHHRFYGHITTKSILNTIPYTQIYEELPRIDDMARRYFKLVPEWLKEAEKLFARREENPPPAEDKDDETPLDEPLTDEEVHIARAEIEDLYVGVDRDKDLKELRTLPEMCQGNQILKMAIQGKYPDWDKYMPYGTPFNRITTRFLYYHGKIWNMGHQIQDGNIFKGFPGQAIMTKYFHNVLQIHNSPERWKDIRYEDFEEPEKKKRRY